jgi:hypothetical protein
MSKVALEVLLTKLVSSSSWENIPLLAVSQHATDHEAFLLREKDSILDLVYIERLNHVLVL